MGWIIRFMHLAFKLFRSNDVCINDIPMTEFIFDIFLKRDHLQKAVKRKENCSHLAQQSDLS